MAKRFLFLIIIFFSLISSAYAEEEGLIKAEVLFEIKNQNPNANYAGLVRSGLKVGRDIMATMINTLILAYVGGAMPILLVFHFMKMPISGFVSTEILATEIIRSLCGSVGLILTIPFTSIIAAMMVPHRKYKRRAYGYKR